MELVIVILMAVLVGSCGTSDRKSNATYAFEFVARDSITLPDTLSPYIVQAFWNGSALVFTSYKTDGYGRVICQTLHSFFPGDNAMNTIDLGRDITGQVNSISNFFADQHEIVFVSTNDKTLSVYTIQLQPIAKVNHRCGPDYLLSGENIFKNESTYFVSCFQSGKDSHLAVRLDTMGNCEPILPDLRLSSRSGVFHVLPPLLLDHYGSTLFLLPQYKPYWYVGDILENSCRKVGVPTSIPVTTSPMYSEVQRIDKIPKQRRINNGFKFCRLDGSRVYLIFQEVTTGELGSNLRFSLSVHDLYSGQILWSNNLPFENAEFYRCLNPKQFLIKKRDNPLVFYIFEIAEVKVSNSK